MGEVMLHGVLNMPIDIWGDDPLDKAQRHSRYVEASRLIVRQQEDIEDLKDTLLKAERDRDQFKDDADSMRVQLRAIEDQPPALHVREDGSIEYNPEYMSDLHGDFYARKPIIHAWPNIPYKDLVESGREMAKQITSLREQLKESRQSAARWDAVINCSRIRALGSAGLEGKLDPYGKPWNGYAHLGLELWSKHSAFDDLSREIANEWLTKFADICIEVLSTEPNRMVFGQSDFIPVELLLKPDLTDEDVNEWKRKNGKPVDEDVWSDNPSEYP